MKCNLCPRQCDAIRTDSENKNGFCQMPLLPKVARADLHFWEEPCISATLGSGTVFFSGCSLKCVFCQNSKISQENFGKVITIERLANIFKQLERKGAHNINLVNPTHYALAIKQALDIYKPNIPIIYNSSGYEKVETLRMLEGYIDIFLLDLKYLDKDHAESYSSAKDYPEFAVQALIEAYRQQPKCIIDDGVMKKGVIVRHLMLPQATKDAIAVFDFVHKNMPNAYFSLMSQYTPFAKAHKIPIINRRITKREYEKVISYICDTDFENIFIQKLESANKDYIPDFDLQGV